MSDAELSCREENRREDVRAASLFGLDYVEVESDDQRTLYVYFLGKAPAQIEQQNLRLTGGRRIRDVQITHMKVHRLTDTTRDDFLEVQVNKPGDFSTYTLSLVEPDGSEDPQPMKGFDPRYANVNFSFKAGCPTDLDCKQPCACPPPQREQPEINYLAKDYESFRQLILDRLALIMPAWQETHAPDLGIALVELLAYAGDYLSYYQDAVATEAYLGTARQRISVRRHARLVDYSMHEGRNARAWVTIHTDTDREFALTHIYFITAFPGAPNNHVLNSLDLADVPASSYDVFEPLWTNGGQSISLWEAHNEIDFYTWGDCECCLPRGATSATLIDRWVPAPTTNPDPGSPGTQPGATPGGTDTQLTQPGAMPGAVAAVRAAAPAAAPTPTSTSTSTSIPTPTPTDSDGPPGTVRDLQHLQAGDVLIFEEVLGPKTRVKEDADPNHRQAVRLTKVTSSVDPLYHPNGPNFGQPIVEIEWAPQDALTFTLCISSKNPYPDCTCMENVSVARGNVVLVDNGACTGEDLGTVPTQSTTPLCPSHCEPTQVEIIAGCYGPTLTQRLLTFSQPLPPPCSAAELIMQDPRQALPWISLLSIPAGICASTTSPPTPVGTTPAPQAEQTAPAEPCQVPPLFTFDDLDAPTGLINRLVKPSDPASQLLYAQLSSETKELLATSPLPSGVGAALVDDLKGLLETWTPVPDLLESGPEDLNFVVEMDDDGYAHLRFGDGELGRQPEAGMAFRAKYRVGNGPSGNVGAETITYLVLRKETLSAEIEPRNPMPARGGTDPEPVQEVKLFAPYAFRTVLERAITADDYATIAEDNGRRWEARSNLAALNPEFCAASFENLQQAKAVLRWMGSWYTMLVALDPEGTEDASRELVDEVTAYLQPYRRMGYDLLVAPAQYVPLDVALRVCVLPNYLRGHVEAALLDALGNRVLPNGKMGFFHPDNLTFGQGIFVSRLVAAAQAVPGVQDVTVTQLERFEISEPAPTDDLPGEELPPGSVLTLGPREIARLDNDPNFPENGRLALDMRGGR